jgi:hypothetical protein
MCFNHEENITHLCIDCPFAAQVWKVLQDNIKMEVTWNKYSIEYCFKEWIEYKAVSLYAGLQSIMIFNLWWEINNNVFKDKVILPEFITEVTLNMDK